MTTPKLPKPPTTIGGGRYTLVRQIAEGGNAVVYLGYDQTEHQYRAIKMLLPEYTKRSGLRSRFEREAHTMMALDHPNIIRVYDWGGDNETAWLAMEFAEVGSVIDWIEKHGPMPPRMATNVAIQLCAGIAHAHREKVIHRDIKPQNLLVDRHGVCKVTDFGIAQVLQETRVTMTGTVMGTIGYMAPEQHESAKHADERADVYSIAASLYTLVHGEAATHLFMAEDRDYDGIPEPLAEVIRKGSQYRKDQRYETVAAMGQALQAVYDRLPPDPASAPPLVGADVKLISDGPPTGNRRPRENESDSLEPPLVPVDLNRTPSSIIPRTSLTGQTGRVRRPRIKNRDEVEWQYKIRRVVLGGAVAFGIMVLGVLATALFGRYELNMAERYERTASEALVTQLTKEWTMVSDKPLEHPDDLDRAFRAAIDEQDGALRDALTGSVLVLITTERQRFADRHQGDEATMKTLEQVDRRLRDVLKAHQARVQELDHARSKLTGRLGALVPL
ncbi:MAG: serine/threonine-protein kinase [Myxococcota bacterium]